MPTCPACAEKISSSDKSCPYCGTRVKGSGGSGKRKKKSSGLPTSMIIGGIALVVLVGCCGVGFALIIPAYQQAQKAARRSQCKNNLKQIGLALHNYADKYGSFPPAYVADASGKPMHSWRVLILPFLDQQALYSEYNFAEPWDGPNNSRLLGRMPPTYACLSHPHPEGNTNTAYAGVFGEHCVFRGTQPVAFKDITDGSSNTMFIAEVGEAGIPWMKPEDIDIAKHPAVADPTGFSSHHRGGLHALMCDGSVRFIPVSIAEATLKALFTRDAGDIPGPF